MRMLDALRAGSLPVATARPARFWASITRQIRNRMNRSAVLRLDGFTDHELADIGLTRSDVRSALEGSRFFEDPSRKLAPTARGQRRS